MVYGELGRFPLSIRVKIRMASFWCKIVNNESKLCSHLYRLMLCLKQKGHNSFRWINYVESIFNDIGLGYIFASQFGYYDKNILKQTLQGQFIQSWFSDIENSSRGQFYSLFKTEHILEKYLLNLPENYRIWITKLRTCNLKIPIETGQWLNVPRHECICNFCNIVCCRANYGVDVWGNKLQVGVVA